MRRWTELFDMPPTQHALELKMEEARRLLRESDLSVIEVAADLGIDDPQYFSRFFRRRQKMSPLRYRAHERDDEAR